MTKTNDHGSFLSVATPRTVRPRVFDPTLRFGFSHEDLGFSGFFNPWVLCFFNLTGIHILTVVSE